MTRIIYRTDPEIIRRLDRIEQAIKRGIHMTKTTNAAIAKITDTVTNLTTTIDAVEALIASQVQASRDLAAELEAEGQDVTKLNALNDALEANAKRITALTLSGTPADTGEPVPDPVATE